MEIIEDNNLHLLNSSYMLSGDMACSAKESAKETTTGRWTAEEHQLFLEGLRQHKKQWKLIADLIKTRTVVQIRTHAQKYFQKLLKANKTEDYDDHFFQEFVGSGGAQAKTSSDDTDSEKKMKQPRSRSESESASSPKAKKQRSEKGYAFNKNDNSRNSNLSILHSSRLNHYNSDDFELGNDCNDWILDSSFHFGNDFMTSTATEADAFGAVQLDDAELAWIAEATSDVKTHLHIDLERYNRSHDDNRDDSVATTSEASDQEDINFSPNLATYHNNFDEESNKIILSSRKRGRPRRSASESDMKISNQSTLKILNEFGGVFDDTRYNYGQHLLESDITFEGIWDSL